MKVIGIAVDGTGEAHCDQKSGNISGARNAIDLIGLSGKKTKKIPVACGPAKPMRGQHVFPEPWRVDSDTLYGIKLPTHNQMPEKEDAVELISSVLKKSKSKVHILAIGPLTNIGLALEREPDLVNKIASIVIMGGAVEAPGNLKVSDSTIVDNKTAEWNIYIDPYAADIVFRSGVPIQLIALDGTNYAQITMPFVELLERKAKTKSAELIYQYLSKEEKHIKKGDLYFWDALAAAIVTNKEICKFKTYSLSVVTKEGTESGWTRQDPKGMPIDVCIKADGKEFEDIFIKTINNPENKI